MPGIAVTFDGQGALGVGKVHSNMAFV
jgi:hypothetical protein